jgi:hypothetical protein
MAGLAEQVRISKEYDSGSDSGYDSPGKVSRKGRSTVDREKKLKYESGDSIREIYSTTGSHGGLEKKRDILHKTGERWRISKKEGGRSKEERGRKSKEFHVKRVAELRREYGGFLRRELKNLVVAWQEDDGRTLEKQLNEIPELSFVNTFFHEFTSKLGPDHDPISTKIRAIDEKKFDEFLKSDAGLMFAYEYRRRKFAYMASRAGMSTGFENYQSKGLHKSKEMLEIAQNTERLNDFVDTQWGVSAYSNEVYEDNYSIRSYERKQHAISMPDYFLKKILRKEARAIRRFDNEIFNQENTLLNRAFKLGLTEADKLVFNTDSGIFNRLLSRGQAFGLEMSVDMNWQIDRLSSSDNKLDQEVVREFKKHFYDRGDENGRDRNPYQFKVKTGDKEEWIDNSPKNRRKYNYLYHLVPGDPDYLDPDRFYDSNNIDNAEAFNLLQRTYADKLAKRLQREIARTTEAGINRPENARKKLDSLVKREKEKVEKDQELLTDNNNLLEGKSKPFNSIKEGLEEVLRKQEKRREIEGEISAHVDRVVDAIPNPATLSKIEILNLTRTAVWNATPFNEVYINGTVIRNIHLRKANAGATHANALNAALALPAPANSQATANANSLYDESMQEIANDEKMLTDTIKAIEQAKKEEKEAYEKFKLNEKQEIQKISQKMDTARQDLERWSALAGVNLTTDGLATQSYDELMNRFAQANEAAKTEITTEAAAVAAARAANEATRRAAVAAAVAAARAAAGAAPGAADAAAAAAEGPARAAALVATPLTPMETALAAAPGAARELAIANALCTELPTVAVAIGAPAAPAGGGPAAVAAGVLEPEIIEKAVAIAEAFEEAQAAAPGAARELEIAKALAAADIGCARRDKKKYENRERLLHAIAEAKASKIVELSAAAGVPNYITAPPPELTTATNPNEWAIQEVDWLTLSEDQLTSKINERRDQLDAAALPGAAGGHLRIALGLPPGPIGAGHALLALPGLVPASTREDAIRAARTAAGIPAEPAVADIKRMAKVRFRARQEAYKNVMDEFEDKKKVLETKKNEIGKNGISDEFATYRKVMDRVDSIGRKIYMMTEDELFEKLISTELTGDEKNRSRYTDAERANNATVAEVELMRLLVDHNNDIIPGDEAYDKYSKIMTPEVWRDLLVDYFHLLRGPHGYRHLARELENDLGASGIASTPAQLESIIAAARVGGEIINREMIVRGVEAVLGVRGLVIPAPGAAAAGGAPTREQLIASVVETTGVSNNVATAILDTIRELDNVAGGTIAGALRVPAVPAAPGVLAVPAVPAVPGTREMAIETIINANNVKPLTLSSAITYLRRRNINTAQFGEFMLSGVVRGYVAQKIEEMV